ncbi:TetR family transcriptional regulator [Gordonia paraffinivorans]|uniref:TetR/AcrR family transcriptional regulator n=1 Tax=Gordonia paraffinivorans TaxID=175628 RepID=UPI000D60A6E8|nr:TetR/AcrR family transcriptional regulator [Gordonia paraffinivorans]MBY4573187.1 TetR family transcriptional regulator [Gordonia paraffinivorans]PWD42372.1 TetR family transcriptional regulator [Gordonia paraffinivorans]
MTAERTYAGRPVSDRAAERRRRFLDAALAEFSSTGYAKSSVTSICRTAGLSRRQFYELFSDREDLLVALYDEIQHAARDAVVDALATAETRDRRELATAAMRAYMESVGTDPRRAEVSFVQIVGVSPRVEQHRLDGREEWVEFFVAAMADFAGLPRDDRRRHLAIAFVGALTSLVHRWSVSTDPAPIAEVVALLSDILVSFADL